MRIYTIGFAKKTAAQFFGILRDSNISRVVDVRLNNVSQLAGFTKRDDIAYFLDQLCDASYAHEPLLAPSQDMLKEYRETDDWELYEATFNALLRERRVEEHLDESDFAEPTALLCSEATPEHCHRRLVAEYLRAKWGDLEIIHL